MWVNCFGFILLIWFPGGLHAQSDAEPCPAPELRAGYFVPENETYSHGTKLQYACDSRHKPVVEGWWATSTCHSGVWSHKPQCIDENACIPPTIVNGKHRASPEGWFMNGRRVWITCDEGYEEKGQAATAQCVDGTWSSLPVCERSSDTCGEPPKIPHAVVILQQYQELFPVDSKVQYECEEGFTIEGAHRNPIICMSGNWTDGPNCKSKPVTGQGGSTEVGTSSAAAAGGGTQSGGGGSRPGTGQGGSTDVGKPGKDTTSAAGGGVGGSRPGAGQGGSADVGKPGKDTTSAGGGGTQSGGGGGRGSSTTSGLRRPTTTINNCGSEPVVTNGEVLRRDDMQLTYVCNGFYALVGEATVVCHDDNSWSQLPSCRDAFCVMKPGPKTYGLTTNENVYMKEGETHVPCVWYDYSVAVYCKDGQISYTQCCRSYDHRTNVCPIIATTS